MKEVLPWSKVHHLCKHSQSMIDWMDFFVVTVSSERFFRYQCVHKIASISCGPNSKKSVHHITAAIKFKIQYTPNNIQIRPQSEIFIKFVYYSKSLKSPKIWSPNYFTISLITTIYFTNVFFSSLLFYFCDFIECIFIVCVQHYRTNLSLFWFMA